MTRHHESVVKISRLKRHQQYLDRLSKNESLEDFQDIASLNPKPLHLTRKGKPLTWMGWSALAVAAACILIFYQQMPDKEQDAPWLTKGGSSLKVQVERAAEHWEFTTPGTLQSHDKVQFEIVATVDSVIFWGVSSAEKKIWLSDLNWFWDERIEVAAKQNARSKTALELSAENEQEVLQIFVCPQALRISRPVLEDTHQELLGERNQWPEIWQKCEYFTVALRNKL